MITLKGDLVKVIAGENKGETGKVIAVDVKCFRTVYPIAYCIDLKNAVSLNVLMGTPLIFRNPTIFVVRTDNKMLNCQIGIKDNNRGINELLKVLLIPSLKTKPW